MTDLAAPELAIAGPEPQLPATSLWRDAWRELRSNWLFWVASVLIAIVVSMALWPAAYVAPSPASHDPRDCALRSPDGEPRDRLPPSSHHWFGTDIQGCDYYARVIYGARASITIGVGATVMALVLGVALGGLAGYAGGWVDQLVSRLTDVFFAFPYLVAAILLLSLLTTEGRSPLAVLTVIGVISWPLPTRLFRASVLQVRQEAYVEAACALGARGSRILLRHILPNAIAPVFVASMISVGAVIGAEATLTFLGIGLQPPAISWGLMINSAQTKLRASPHLLLFPGLFLTLAVLAFLLLADSVRDALDPRLR